MAICHVLCYAFMEMPDIAGVGEKIEDRGSRMGVAAVAGAIFYLLSSIFFFSTLPAHARPDRLGASAPRPSSFIPQPSSFALTPPAGRDRHPPEAPDPHPPAVGPKWRHPRRETTAASVTAAMQCPHPPPPSPLAPPAGGRGAGAEPLLPPQHPRRPPPSGRRRGDPAGPGARSARGLIFDTVRFRQRAGRTAKCQTCL